RIVAWIWARVASVADLSSPIHLAASRGVGISQCPLRIEVRGRCGDLYRLAGKNVSRLRRAGGRRWHRRWSNGSKLEHQAAADLSSPHVVTNTHRRAVEESEVVVRVLVLCLDEANVKSLE